MKTSTRNLLAVAIVAVILLCSLAGAVQASDPEHPSGEALSLTPTAEADQPTEVEAQVAAPPVTAPLAVVSAGLTGLVLDDGTFEASVWSSVQIICLNRFTPDPEAYPFQLQEILIYFQGGDAGDKVGDDITLVAYENTTGSFDPAPGSNLVLSKAATVKSLDAWNVYDLEEPVTLNGPGDILIGFITGRAMMLVPLDRTTGEQRSWLGYWNASPPPTPPTLPPDQTWMLVFDGGNWPIRGYGTTLHRVYLPLVAR